jgi:cyclic pyranopterin phosphate synthase
LTAVNISLDTLVPAKFELLTRRAGHDRVLASVRAALAAGFAPVKLNCVVMRGVNDDELLDFVALTRDADINVRFIEYMPFDGNAWAARKMVPYAEMRATVAAVHPGCVAWLRAARGLAETRPRRMARLDDAPDEVAKNFRVPGHVGSVSFISSMTSHFCAGCSRLRLLADGALKVCLFGASEVSLRDPLRAGADNAVLAAVIAGAVARKKPAHDGVPVAQLFTRPNRAMIRIGG